VDVICRSPIVTDGLKHWSLTDLFRCGVFRVNAEEAIPLKLEPVQGFGRPRNAPIDHGLGECGHGVGIDVGEEAVRHLGRVLRVLVQESGKCLNELLLQ
jgi:hypothetical protein